MGNQSNTFDLKEAMTVFEGQLERFQKFAPMLCQDMREQVNALVMAVSESDAATAERCAHTIKGHASTLGGKETRQVAYDAELSAKAGKMDELQTLSTRLKREVENLTQAIESVDPVELRRYADNFPNS